MAAAKAVALVLQGQANVAMKRDAFRCAARAFLPTIAKAFCTSLQLRPPDPELLVEIGPMNGRGSARKRNCG
jgi:hypothetical protein